ncbi:hypothetical protein O181_030365 [Austropuccinia psidii MF-1]|uniref:Uncharacterized protein n=1 Tax=Austropuccinia psidii MF-1 TaxID=1389203 RepID=A0A9Q3CW52_9BASI|nr:hypothetical protein [Austropuccinia psidii MF-1]
MKVFRLKKLRISACVAIPRSLSKFLDDMEEGPELTSTLFRSRASGSPKIFLITKESSLFSFFLDELEIGVTQSTNCFIVFYQAVDYQSLSIATHSAARASGIYSNIPDHWTFFCCFAEGSPGSTLLAPKSVDRLPRASSGSTTPTSEALTRSSCDAADLALEFKTSSSVDSRKPRRLVHVPPSLRKRAMLQTSSSGLVLWAQGWRSPDASVEVDLPMLKMIVFNPSTTSCTRI